MQNLVQFTTNFKIFRVSTNFRINSDIQIRNAASILGTLPMKAILNNLFMFFVGWYIVQHSIPKVNYLTVFYCIKGTFFLSAKIKVKHRNLPKLGDSHPRICNERFACEWPADSPTGTFIGSQSRPAHSRALHVGDKILISTFTIQYFCYY